MLQYREDQAKEKTNKVDKLLQESRDIQENYCRYKGKICEHERYVLRCKYMRGRFNTDMCDKDYKHKIEVAHMKELADRKNNEIIINECTDYRKELDIKGTGRQLIDAHYDYEKEE